MQFNICKGRVDRHLRCWSENTKSNKRPLQSTHGSPGQFRRVGLFYTDKTYAGYYALKEAGCDGEALENDPPYSHSYTDDDGLLKEDGVARKVITLI